MKTINQNHLEELLSFLNGLPHEKLIKNVSHLKNVATKLLSTYVLLRILSPSAVCLSLIVRVVQRRRHQQSIINHQYIKHDLGVNEDQQLTGSASTTKQRYHQQSIK